VVGQLLQRVGIVRLDPGALRPFMSVPGPNSEVVSHSWRVRSTPMNGHRQTGSTGPLLPATHHRQQSCGDRLFKFLRKFFGELFQLSQTRRSGDGVGPDCDRCGWRSLISCRRRGWPLDINLPSTASTEPGLETLAGSSLALHWSRASHYPSHDARIGSTRYPAQPSMRSFWHHYLVQRVSVE